MVINNREITAYTAEEPVQVEPTSSKDAGGRLDDFTINLATPAARRLLELVLESGMP